MTSPAPQLLHRAFAPVVAGSTWRTTLKVYFDMAWMALAAAVVLVPAVVGSGLVLILPLAVVFGSIALVANRVCARIDRIALEEFLGLHVPSPHRRAADVPTGRFRFSPLRLWRWFVSQLTDPAAWRAILYRLVSLPVTAASAFVTTIAWSASLALLSTPLWVRRMPPDRLFFLPRPVFAVLAMAAGAVVLALAPRVVALVGRLQTITARLLGPRREQELEERIEQVETSRSRVVDAAEAERRRIERDLHDGAQQRLVALAMNLGMAKERYDVDPEGTRVLIAEAHAEAKRAMVELRDLARGLHPAVLTDRGLGPALSAVAARSTVPVTVEIDVSGRLDETTEGIAYFLVCEALANVAKHSDATAARVNVGRRGDRLVIEVTDDGRGGADPTGSGLTGLRDRVEGVDGWFHVASPVGGPTTLLAELPCAS